MEAKPAGGESKAQSRRGLGGTVRALGVVSLLTDVSSEMVYPVNPLFLTAALRAPAEALGLIEGLAESTASILKLYSGWLSDRAGRRKPLTLAGYALGALGKPLVGIAAAWQHVLGARLLDRIGKGLRSAPRDALIAENCAPDQRGRAFGFHRSMDTLGAVLGPLIGYLFLSTAASGTDLAGDPGALRAIYWVAFIPGVLAVAVLWLFVRERAPAPALAGDRPALARWGQLSREFRWYLVIVAVFSVGNSSDAFLLLHAQQGLHVGPAHVLLLFALFNVVEAVLSYPVGILSDRVGRRSLIAAGWAVFAFVYLGFALGGSSLVAWVLFPVYGLYYTLTGGVQRALAADLAHPDRRATEIGAYHMVVGILALPAGVAAGLLYERVSPAAPFVLGAAAAALAAALLLTTAPRVRRGEVAS